MNLCKKLLLISLCASTVLVSASATAQSNDNQDNEQSQITLNLEAVDIRVLIDTVAGVSGKNFIVDQRVKGKVSVVSGAPLAPEELYDMFLSILEVHNYSTVESGNAIKIVPTNVIKQRPTPTLFSATTDNNDSQVTQIIQLKHASVQDLVAIVRPLIPPTSHFAPHVPSNSLVMTDTTANIQRVLKIIKRIDVPDKRAQVRVVYLEHATASEMANTLSQLVASRRGASAQAGASGATVSIQAIDSINALVVSAPDDSYGKIRALIGELDIQREIKSDVNVVYLKHANAVDLVTVLSDVTANNGNDNNGQNPISVQADEATNSLIVKAPTADYNAIKNIIDKLDIRRAQVYIEAVIANVSVDHGESLGIDWDGGDVISSSSSTVAGIGNSDLSNVNFSGGGLTYSLFNAGSDQLNVLVDAIRNDTNSNILSTPTILTLDNEEAEILVGQEVPFVTGSFTSATDGGDGNAFQTIERQDVGTQLKIKPQINEGDTIRLEVEQEISSVVMTEVNGASDLLTNTSSITAIVQVDHGQVIALGGLASDSVSDTISGIPVLSRIPLIGSLFRNKSKEVTRQDLMVFLKPYIIRSPEELTKYSKTRYDQTRRAEQRSLKGSSKFLVPGARPAVLDEYDNVTGDGTFGTVRTRKLDEKYEKKRLKKLKKEALKESTTGGVLESINETVVESQPVSTGSYVPTNPESLKQSVEASQ